MAVSGSISPLKLRKKNRTTLTKQTMRKYIREQVEEFKIN